MDLVLLDVMMPEINGFEVCRWLKEQEQYRDMPGGDDHRAQSPPRTASRGSRPAPPISFPSPFDQARS